jgi:hypothetical protein
MGKVMRGSWKGWIIGEARCRRGRGRGGGAPARPDRHNSPSSDIETRRRATHEARPPPPAIAMPSVLPSPWWSDPLQARSAGATGIARCVALRNTRERRAGFHEIRNGDRPAPRQPSRVRVNPLSAIGTPAENLAIIHQNVNSRRPE